MQSEYMLLFKGRYFSFLKGLSIYKSTKIVSLLLCKEQMYYKICIWLCSDNTFKYGSLIVLSKLTEANINFCLYVVMFSEHNFEFASKFNIMPKCLLKFNDYIL